MDVERLPPPSSARPQRGLTQVVQAAQQLGLARLGTVAIDSTRLKASASRNRIDFEQQLRDRRARIRRDIRALQKQLTDEDPDAQGGMNLGPERIAKLEKAINATALAKLAEALQLSPKGIQRMLGPSGNPQATFRFRFSASTRCGRAPACPSTASTMGTSD